MRAMVAIRNRTAALTNFFMSPPGRYYQRPLLSSFIDEVSLLCPTLLAFATFRMAALASAVPF